MSRGHRGAALRTLIIRPAAVGDTLMLAPALEGLRHSASVDLLGRYPGISYVSRLVRRCLDFEARGWHTLFMNRVELPQVPQMDCVVAFLKDPGGTVRKNLEATFPDAQVHMVPGLPSEKEEVHVALHLALCLEKAGLEVDGKACFEEAQQRALLCETALDRNGKIVLHPGSGGHDKNHPIDYWLKLIDALLRDLPLKHQGLLVLLGPAEEGIRPFLEEPLMEKEGEILISPERERLFSALSSAPLYLGQDSGMTHLAAMLGAPTVALFKNSSVQRWRPLGPHVRVLLDREGTPPLPSDVVSAAKALMGQDGEYETNYP